MPALSNIVIADGANTPINRTYVPTKKIAGQDILQFTDRVTGGGVPIGAPTARVSLSEPVKTGKVWRCKLMLELPTLDVTSPSTGSGIQPAPSVGYTHVFKGEFLLPTRGTTLERAHIAALAGNLIKHATIVSMIKDLEDIISG